MILHVGIQRYTMTERHIEEWVWRHCDMFSLHCNATAMRLSRVSYTIFVLHYLVFFKPLWTFWGHFFSDTRATPFVPLVPLPVRECARRCVKIPSGVSPLSSQTVLGTFDLNLIMQNVTHKSWMCRAGITLHQIKSLEGRNRSAGNRHDRCLKTEKSSAFIWIQGCKSEFRQQPEQNYHKKCVLENVGTFSWLYSWGKWEYWKFWALGISGIQ